MILNMKLEILTQRHGRATEHELNVNAREVTSHDSEKYKYIAAIFLTTIQAEQYHDCSEDGLKTSRIDSWLQNNFH